jgi:hypothetical protein
MAVTRVTSDVVVVAGSALRVSVDCTSSSTLVSESALSVVSASVAVVLEPTASVVEVLRVTALDVVKSVVFGAGDEINCCEQPAQITAKRSDAREVRLMELR